MMVTYVRGHFKNVRGTLTFDPQSELVVGDVEANGLMQRQYREHWGTPKKA